jgi:ABC-type iron transport system FetAB ATPase subunit
MVAADLRAAATISICLQVDDGQCGTSGEIMSLRIRNMQFLEWSGIELELEAGEAVSLLGESGSGKSLLLRAIADLICNDGTLELDGRERASFSPQEWRRAVGYLPAEIFWWEASVGAHFEHLPTEIELKRLRLSLESLDWAPSRLSMGERQRLGILRMLDRKPSVLLLDEPTANLDDEMSSVVESLILEYLESIDAAALWVTHSKAQAARVGKRTYLMRNKALELAGMEETVG